MIANPDNRTRRIKTKYDTDDIVDALLKVDADRANATQIKDFALSIADPDLDTTLRRLWAFMIKEFRYIEDGLQYQNIKTPARLYADQKGDCKSFTIFIGAFLQAIKVPYRINFVGFGNDPNFKHVYPSVIINGEEVNLDVVLTLQHGLRNQYGKRAANITTHTAYEHG